jgi:ribose transport system permease protein
VTDTPVPLDDGLPYDQDVPAPTPSRGRRLHHRAAHIANRYGVLVAWAMFVVLWGVIEPSSFLTVGNLQAIFGTEVELVVLALAVMIPLTVAEFDLSVAGTMGISYILLSYLSLVHGWPFIPALIIALLSGLVVGVVNSFFIVVIGVESIIVTLGTGTVLTGLGYAFVPGPLTGLSMTFTNDMGRLIFGLPLMFYGAIVLAAMLWYVFDFTPLGRYMYFVGANRSVSKLAGIRVDRIRVGSLLASGGLSAVAGIVLAAETGGADPGASSSYLLPVFAAVFLGATTIHPGRFNPWGTVIAVYFLTTGISGLELLGYSGWVEQVFYGGALVLAVAASRLAGRTVTSAGL